MTKGLDGTFLHYGIRKDDLEFIESLCEKHQLDPDWVKEEILRAYHDNKVEDLNVPDNSVSRIINKAIQKIQ